MDTEQKTERGQRLVAINESQQRHVGRGEHHAKTVCIVKAAVRLNVTRY